MLPKSIFRKEKTNMSGEKGILSRRDFIKAAGAAGLGSALGPLSSLTTAHASTSTKAPEQMVVPTRPYGKRGVDVSILSLGGVLKDTDQLVFRQAFKSGVTYWDTADSYGWGNNEKAIGDDFAKFPGDRGKGVPGNQNRQFKRTRIVRQIEHLASANEYVLYRYVFHSLCKRCRQGTVP